MTGSPTGNLAPMGGSPPATRQDERIRVLIADGSPTPSTQLIAVLGDDPQLEIVGLARDGAASMRAAGRLRPDVIAMALELPIMDGLEATRQIMQQHPTPIVVVTATTSPRDSELVLAAMEAGALAVVARPTVSPAPDQAAQELVRAVKSVAGMKLVRRWGPRAATPAAARDRVAARIPQPSRPEIVAIGASTGGPQVLQTILTQLPASFPLPVLVVQHITAGFAAGLVEWLRPQCALPVSLAQPGLALPRPGIFVAPTGQHLVVQGRTLGTSDAPPVSGHRPSATVLLRSVARAYGRRAVGVLLTGMGDDGAAGLVDVKRAGGFTIAQDEATSVVFGMPAAAIALGAVDRILPARAIPAALVDLLASGGPERGEAVDGGG